MLIYICKKERGESQTEGEKKMMITIMMIAMWVALIALIVLIVVVVKDCIIPDIKAEKERKREKERMAELDRRVAERRREEWGE